MEYTEYLTVFVDRTGSQSSDLCREIDAYGMTTGSLEEAHSYGKNILKKNPDTLKAYKVYKQVID